MTVLRVEPPLLIGVDESINNTKFSEGTLIVDENETILCHIDKITFLNTMNEKELTRLVKSTDCIIYPKEEDILVQ